ncbi:hypothetical protein BKA80DRAFT_272447 [Phyllosticta citrichinensis]
MERDYEQLRWDERKREKDFLEFSKCETPTERTKLDLERFINFYFLTKGKPNKTKTPEPLAMYGLRDLEVEELRKLAKKVPGLHTKGGNPGGNRTLYINPGVYRMGRCRGGLIGSRCAQAQNGGIRAAERGRLGGKDEEDRQRLGCSNGRTSSVCFRLYQRKSG